VNFLNKNIEVINLHLWAVRFHLIPLIPEIDYKPDSEIPEYEEFGRVINTGVLLLNKDYKGYHIFKEWLPKIMGKTDKQISKEIKAGQALINKSDWEMIYLLMLQVELDRRAKERGER
jgi:hypothetical protein